LVSGRIRQTCTRLIQSASGRVAAGDLRLHPIESVELLERWHASFEAHYKRRAGPDDDRAYIETSFRDIVWEWQDVLPPDLKAA